LLIVSSLRDSSEVEDIPDKAGNIFHRMRVSQSGGNSTVNRRNLKTRISAAMLFVASLSAAQQHTRASGDPARGKEVFERCTSCHNSDSDEMKYGPSLKGLFKHSKLHNGTSVTVDAVRAKINSGGDGMPAFGTVLSGVEKADLIAYLKTL
jgi:cytochrome c